MVAAPLMRSLAESKRINVGLAAPDRDDMVYLESIRYSRRVAFRNVVSGQRVPMELTSLGRAYLATTSLPRRKSLYEAFKARRRTQWPSLLTEIEEAIRSVHADGYCVASWQPEVVALAAPIATTEGHYSLNVSVSTVDSTQSVVDALAGPLLDLHRQIAEAWSRRVEA